MKIKQMKSIIFVSLIILTHSACTSSQYEYNGNCYSSCQDINLFQRTDSKTCVPNCKSLDYFRNGYKCQPTCSKTRLINDGDLDKFCLSTTSYCEIYGKKNQDYTCYDSCKSKGGSVTVAYYNMCTSSCTKFIYEDENESYCVSSCKNFGLINNVPCAKNCKSIGKFYYDLGCKDSCTGNYKTYLTGEENFCTLNCEYHNMVKPYNSQICSETCKSVGQIQGSSGCSLSPSYNKLTYKNEDYDERYCELYKMAYGPSSTCVKNCKEIGLVRYTNSCLSKCNTDNSRTQIYPFEYENEIYCLNKEQCNSIGKYPNYINGIYSCDDDCDESTCTKNCGINQYYSVPGKKCVNSCREEGLFLYDKYCINTCPIFSKSLYNGQTEDICLSECPEDAPFLDYSSNKCLQSCNELYIFENMCVSSCPKAGVYINEVGENKYCVKNCHEYGLYNIISQKQCTDNCKQVSQYLYDDNCITSCISEAPYQYEGDDEYICTKNCAKYGLLIDVDNTKCVTNCKILGKVRYEDRCVSSCPFNVKFKYSTNEEDFCVERCDLYGQKNSELSCTEQTCKSRGHYFMNGICVNCLEGYSFKVVGDTEDFCTLNCGEYGLVADFKTSKCVISSMSCPSNQFKNFVTQQCVNKCPNDLPYIIDNICIKNCETFYYEDSSGNKRCIDSCSGSYKYMIINIGKCVSSCEDINNYQLNGYDICYSDCNLKSIIPRFYKFTKDIFSSCVQLCLDNDNTKEESDCINDCSRPFKYKLNDDSDKKCYQSCEEIGKYEYIDENNNFLCVDSCKELNKILYKNKCIDRCPNDKRIKSAENGEITCRSSCGADQYTSYDKVRNEYTCSNKCKDINLIFDNNKCVSSCPAERPIIITENGENKCTNSCDNNKFINKINNYEYECITNCNSKNKFLNENTCVNYCPSSKNYIINKNNEMYCSLSCDDEYKYINEINNNKFCVKSCKLLGKLLYNGKCVDKCPDSKNIELEKGNEIECSNQCEGDKYVLEQSNKIICVSDCSVYNQMLYEGKCMTECPKGKYLYEDLTNGKKLCIDDCRIHNLYSNDNKCVQDCKIFNKMNLNGQCLSECPGDYPYSSNGICKNNPCKDGEFYDFFTGECFSKCDSINNYKNNDNDICINSCKNINFNKIYSIQNDTCISNCNEQNKFLYLYNNEYYCLDNCKDKNLLISEDGKYCVESCDENAPYKNINNQCVSSCNNLYINNNNECVEECPKDLPDIYNNKCINSCYDNFLYKIYNTNICVDSCSNGLILNSENKPFYFLENYQKCLNNNGNNEESCQKPFYLFDRENRICYQNCSQSINTKFIFKNEECVGNCKYGIDEGYICNNDEEINNNCNCNTNSKSKEKNNSNFLHFKYLLIYYLFFMIIN